MSVPRPKKTNHYVTLGVEPTASQREIKQAYNKLSLQWHPDKNKEQDAEEVFKIISNAYATLSDEDERRNYDQMHPELFRKTSQRDEYKEFYDEFSSSRGYSRDYSFWPPPQQHEAPVFDHEEPDFDEPTTFEQLNQCLRFGQLLTRDADFFDLDGDLKEANLCFKNQQEQKNIYNSFVKLFEVKPTLITVQDPEGHKFYGFLVITLPIKIVSNPEEGSIFAILDMDKAPKTSPGKGGPK